MAFVLTRHAFFRHGRATLTRVGVPGSPEDAQGRLASAVNSTIQVFRSRRRTLGALFLLAALMMLCLWMRGMIVEDYIIARIGRRAVLFHSRQRTIRMGQLSSLHDLILGHRLDRPPIPRRRQPRRHGMDVQAHRLANPHLPGRDRTHSARDTSVSVASSKTNDFDVIAVVIVPALRHARLL